MLKIKTKGKVKFVLPEIVIIRGKMYSPRVVYSIFGSLLVLEPMISTDEVGKEVK